MNSINWPASSIWVFIAQLGEHCSANAESTGSNPVEAPKNFFSGYFRNCLNGDSLRWSHTHFTFQAANKRGRAERKLLHVKMSSGATPHAVRTRPRAIPQALTKNFRIDGLPCFLTQDTPRAAAPPGAPLLSSTASDSVFKKAVKEIFLPRKWGNVLGYAVTHVKLKLLYV